MQRIFMSFLGNELWLMTHDGLFQRALRESFADVRIWRGCVCAAGADGCCRWSGGRGADRAAAFAYGPSGDAAGDDLCGWAGRVGCAISASGNVLEVVQDEDSPWHLRARAAQSRGRAGSSATRRPRMWMTPRQRKSSPGCTSRDLMDCARHLVKPPTDLRQCWPRCGRPTSARRRRGALIGFSAPRPPPPSTCPHPCPAAPQTTAHNPD